MKTITNPDKEKAMTNRKTLRRVLNLAFVVALTLPVVPVDASWLSDLTGVDVNLSKGRVRVGRPDPRGAIERLPKVVEGTIRDAGTGFTSVPLAEAIRISRNRARQSCRPLPRHVAADLSYFFPAEVMRRVCYSTDWGAAQNGTLQQFVLSNGHANAIALGDVIVFADPRLLEDRWLWAHEMRHIEQYQVLGIEEFSRRYIWDSRELENDADDYADHVMSYPVQGY